MTVPHIDAATLRELVPMADAIDVLRRAFAGPLHHVERTAVEIDGADLLVMPAVHGGFAGVKSIVVQPLNAGTDRPVIGGSYVLLNVSLACAVATFDGAALTRLRTPAISAIAVDLLSPDRVDDIVILGRGPQGDAHAEALAVVRPNARITMLGRTRSPGEVSLLRSAQVVVTCTSSAVPVIDAAAVRSDATIVAVGSYRPERAELAADLVLGAEVWVDDVAACRTEAGDLHLAAAQGWSWDHLAGDLCALITRGRDGRTARTDRRAVFKSVGLAAEDLIVAAAAYETLNRGV